MEDLQPARSQRNLDGLAWHMGSVPQRPWDGPGNAYDLDRVAEWLPATVPGNVRSDLLAAGRIPDPFLGDGAAASRWTEAVDWWYRTDLPLGLEPGWRAFLELDGVDYRAAVFVDACELGRHEGMFGRQVYEIAPDLAERPQVELAVRIWGSDALPAYGPSTAQRLWGRIAGRLQNSFAPFDDRLAVIKAPMHFGWDFAPRLRAMGIWDGGRLIRCRGVYLADVRVRAEPLALPADPGPARLRVHLTLDGDRPQAITAQLVVRPHRRTGDIWRFDLPLDLPAGRSFHVLSVELPAARLWQPWERGEPCLHELAVTLWPAEIVDEPPAAHALDTATVRFGVRRVERRATAGQRPWQIVVNGEPLFLRGVNWVPVDALPGRARRGHYEPLLQRAREAGINFLRVWGGGGREKAAFYDLCDELGLLVWQEFPIACVFLDHLPRSPRYLALLQREAMGTVRALRNHPCLFLWCGGNEFSPSRNRQVVRTLAEVVAREDGDRLWVPASPGPGDAHNWDVWHGGERLAAYRREKAAFVSEFGLQAPPAVESLRRFLTPDELWPPGAGWTRHRADLPKLRRYAASFEDPEMVEHGLKAFVAAGQQAQAAGLQVMVEHMRRRRGETGGLAVWQWNEPWPAISWSIVDYFGRLKPAYDLLKQVMQPVLVSFDFAPRRYLPGDLLSGSLWLINDGTEALTGCQLAVCLDELPVHGQDCAVPAQTAAEVGKLTLRLPARFQRVRLALRQGNKPLAENVYDLRFHDGNAESRLRLLRRRGVDLILR